MSRVFVVRHLMALSARETDIQWEFGLDLKGPVHQGGSETVPLAVKRVVTAVENILSLESVALVAAPQARWMTVVRGKVDAAWSRTVQALDEPANPVVHSHALERWVNRSHDLNEQGKALVGAVRDLCYPIL